MLKRPALYERTSEQFWTDPHISAQLLAAHLDPNTDAASRKPEFIERSVAWITSLPLPERARLLDIGCGPGLYAKRFAARGLRVTGMDFSARSIAYAREHDPHSEYVVQDYLAMNYDGAFDIVTLIYCDYGALLPGERAELLRRVHGALKPGGLFVLDAYTPRCLAAPGKSREFRLRGGLWSPGAYACFSARYRYSERVEVNRHVVIDKGGRCCYNIWNTCFTRQTLLDELLPAGFAAEGIYGDAAGAPCTDDTEIICIVLRKEN